MGESFEDRLESIRRRIEAACAASGRQPDDVSILPVTKTYGPEAVAAAAACGLSEFGESRVQEAMQKIPLCPTHLKWHMIGHLQRNKVRSAVELFDMIHSVDSVRLLETVAAACREAGKTMPVLLEVNLSGESTKYGLPEAEVTAAIAAAEGMERIEIVGLMTMAPLVKDPEDARGLFRRARELRDGLQERTGLTLRELSMGMSNDYHVAVEEGATMVRLGSVLFGKRDAWSAPRDTTGMEDGFEG